MVVVAAALADDPTPASHPPNALLTSASSAGDGSGNGVPGREFKSEGASVAADGAMNAVGRTEAIVWAAATRSSCNGSVEGDEDDGTTCASALTLEALETGLSEVEDEDGFERRVGSPGGGIISLSLPLRLLAGKRGVTTSSICDEDEGAAGVGGSFSELAEASCARDGSGRELVLPAI